MADEGYRPDRLEALFGELVCFGVSLLEQPLPRGRDELDPPLPIAADESLQGFADLAVVAGRYQMANIKLDKCGGLTEALALALAMAAEARRLRLGLMVCNMDGSASPPAPGCSPRSAITSTSMARPFWPKTSQAGPATGTAWLNFRRPSGAPVGSGTGRTARPRR